jgi:membrane protein
MTLLKRLFDRAKSLAWHVPGLRVLAAATRSYVFHQSANHAGSVAFSFVLAMFPLLILMSAAASYIGQPGDAAALAKRVLEYAPQPVRELVKPAIDQVLAQRSQALLTIGLLATLWIASSGLQAIRSALNRAYGIERGLPFWKARIKVIIFTILAGTSLLVAFGSVVIMPYAWQLLEEHPVAEQRLFLSEWVRYGSAFVVLTGLYSLLYAWLPDVRQRIRTVLPGAVAGAALWTTAAAILSHALSGAAKLVLLYGSFAGVVATLMFLYACAATLIFGAEINGVLLRGDTGRRSEAPAGTGHRPERE